MDLFSQLIQGNMPEKNDESEEFLTTEAVFAETIPYMKTLPRIFNLPKGNPIGRGNLCYVYSNDVNTSIHDIMNSKNAVAGNNYYFYYLAPLYRGKIYSKFYHERILDKRKIIYKKIDESGRVHSYRKLVIDKSEKRSMFFDLGHYMHIFFTYIIYFFTNFFHLIH